MAAGRDRAADFGRAAGFALAGLAFGLAALALHATDICRSTYPSWVQVAPDRGVACHLYPPQSGAA